ncbi:MAG TPA: hypothetical protein VNB06_07770 [Thermoanaerobaculia bacterium]|nr:hypothetical protein [Thermoanaerobaculia bacterium]
MTKPEAELEIARLEARVAALEEALVVRSRELRLLIEHLDERELLILSRIHAGLPPRPRYAFEPALWRETTELTTAEVEPVLEDLWRSIAPHERHNAP